MACQSALNNSASPSTSQDPPPPASRASKHRRGDRKRKGKKSRFFRDTNSIRAAADSNRNSLSRSLLWKRDTASGDETKTLEKSRIHRRLRFRYGRFAARCSRRIASEGSRLSPRCKHPPELVCSDGKRKTCKRKFNRSLKFK